MSDLAKALDYLRPINHFQEVQAELERYADGAIAEMIDAEADIKLQKIGKVEAYREILQLLSGE